MQIIFFLLAVATEIAGCFAFWSVFKLDKSLVWLIPGTICLILFAYFLTFIQADYAGRVYAIYSAIYVAASFAWMWAFEGNAPDRWDIAGSVICLIGAAFILWGPRG